MQTLRALLLVAAFAAPALADKPAPDTKGRLKGEECSGACVKKRSQCDSSCEDKKTRCVVACGVPVLPGYDQCRQQCDDRLRVCSVECASNQKTCEVQCKAGH
jgi:hypothetical protein